MISFWISVVPPKIDWMGPSRRTHDRGGDPADWYSRRSRRALSWSARAAAFARCDLGGDHTPWDHLAASQLPEPRRGIRPVTACTVQGTARVRSGQAPAWPLVSDQSVRRGSRVKRDFTCTFTRHFFSPVLAALRSQSRLRLEGRTRMLSGPSPDLSQSHDSCTLGRRARWSSSDLYRFSIPSPRRRLRAELGTRRTSALLRGASAWARETGRLCSKSGTN